MYTSSERKKERVWLGYIFSSQNGANFSRVYNALQRVRVWVKYTNWPARISLRGHFKANTYITRFPLRKYTAKNTFPQSWPTRNRIRYGMERGSISWRRGKAGEEKNLYYITPELKWKWRPIFPRSLFIVFFAIFFLYTLSITNNIVGRAFIFDVRLYLARCTRVKEERAHVQYTPLLCLPVCIIALLYIYLTIFRWKIVTQVFVKWKGCVCNIPIIPYMCDAWNFWLAWVKVLCNIHKCREFRKFFF